MVRGRNPLGRPQSYKRIPLLNEPRDFGRAGGARPLFLRKGTGALVNMALVPDFDVSKVSASFVQQMAEITASVNARSVQWLQERAVRELEASQQAHGRPGSSGRLKAAITSPTVSSSNANEFTFFKYDEAVKIAKYFRAIEEGSRASVGRVVPLEFYGGLGGGRLIKPDFSRYPEDFVRRAPFGPKEKGVRFVTIKTPIQAYRYLERTRVAFRAQSVYYRFLSGANNKLAKLAPAGYKLSAAAGTRPAASVLS